MAPRRSWNQTISSHARRNGNTTTFIGPRSNAWILPAKASRPGLCGSFPTAPLSVSIRDESLPATAQESRQFHGLLDPAASNYAAAWLWI